MHFFDIKPEEKVLHIGWISNTYNLSSYLFTVWQWVWKADLAKAVEFTSRPYDDDVEWTQNMLKTHNIVKYPRYEQPFYFYNYMREGSVMYTRKFEEL